MDMQVYIANLGKYNEGELVGEWFTQPIDIEDVKERIGLNIEVDAGYKTPSNAYFLFKESITPYMPYTRPRGPKESFRKNGFVYDEYYNEYICPANHTLKYTRTDCEGFKLYHSNPNVCKACTFLNKCTENKQYKKQIQRHIWQEYLEDVEEIRHTEEGRMV